MLKSLFKPIYLNIRKVLLRALSPFLLNKKNPIDINEIKNILIIRLDGIGDMVLSIPTIEAIRKLFPKSNITLISAEAPSQIFLENPIVDNIHIYNETTKMPSKNYDLVFDLFDNYQLKSAFLTYQTKAKYRIGFDTYGRGAFFTHPVKTPKAQEHYTKAIFQLLDIFNVNRNIDAPKINITEHETNKLNDYLLELGFDISKSIIAIHPGGKSLTQRWFPEKFSKLCTKLIENQLNQIILLGSKEEEPLIKQIKKNISIPVHSVTQESLRFILSIIQKSDLLISNNSGLLHSATALNTPTVSTMGPTISEKWWPLGNKNIVIRKNIPCIGCNNTYCKIKTHDCMKLISVNEIFNATLKQLNINQENIN